VLDGELRILRNEDIQLNHLAIWRKLHTFVRGEGEWLAVYHFLKFYMSHYISRPEKPAYLLAPSGLALGRNAQKNKKQKKNPDNVHSMKCGNLISVIVPFSAIR